MSKLSSKRLLVTAVPFLVMALASACDDLPDEPDPIARDDGGASSEPAGNTYVDARVEAGTEAGSDADIAADAHVKFVAPPIDAGPGHSLIDADTQPQVGDASPMPSSFDKMYALIGDHCAGCHGAGKTLDLSTPELAHAQLVGVEARYPACSSSDGSVAKQRVVAGMPDQSLLIDKLEGRQTCGKQMPTKMLLPSASVDVFRAWILAGAPAR
jgi:mono/diheme cytochrome c family protein